MTAAEPVLSASAGTQPNDTHTKQFASHISDSHLWTITVSWLNTVYLYYYLTQWVEIARLIVLATGEVQIQSNLSYCLLLIVAFVRDKKQRSATSDWTKCSDLRVIRGKKQN